METGKLFFHSATSIGLEQAEGKPDCFIYFIFCIFTDLDLWFAGSGHFVYIVYSLCSAGDPGEAIEKSEHGP